MLVEALAGDVSCLIVSGGLTDDRGADLDGLVAVAQQVDTEQHRRPPSWYSNDCPRPGLAGMTVPLGRLCRWQVDRCCFLWWASDL